MEIYIYPDLRQEYFIRHDGEFSEFYCEAKRETWLCYCIRVVI